MVVMIIQCSIRGHWFIIPISDNIAVFFNQRDIQKVDLVIILYFISELEITIKFIEYFVSYMDIFFFNATNRIINISIIKIGMMLKSILSLFQQKTSRSSNTRSAKRGEVGEPISVPKICW